MNKFNLSKYLSFGFFRHLSDKEKKEYGERIWNLVSDSAMDRIYSRLDFAKQKEMLELFNEEDGMEKEKRAFLKENAQDLKGILIEESLKLKRQIEKKINA